MRSSWDWYRALVQSCLRSIRCRPDGRIGITSDDNTLPSAGPNAVLVIEKYA